MQAFLRCFGWVLALQALSPCTALPEARAEEVPLVADLDDPPETRIRLTPTLALGVSLQVQYEHEGNFDLDDSIASDRSLLRPELSLVLSYDPDLRVQVFLALDLDRESVSGNTDDTSDEVRLDLTQAYVEFSDLVGHGVDLQMGRQRFEDEREWLYDEELDAVRVVFHAGRFVVEGSASREDLVDRNLLPHDQRPADPVNNYIAYATYSFDDEAGVSAYTVIRDDRSGLGESPRFLGVHASGEAGTHASYWVEAAHVRGSNGSKQIRGWGGDVGGTYGFDARLQPAVGIGFAVGSGDADPDDEIDRRFRQTGLEDNTDELTGISSVKYYGELVAPELSNIRIITVSAGVTPTADSSLEAVYHHYRQDTASDDLTGARIDLDPTGESSRLGSEIDLIASYRGLRGLEVEVTLAALMPGPAFPSEADRAYFIGVEIQFEF